MDRSGCGMSGCGVRDDNRVAKGRFRCVKSDKSPPVPVFRPRPSVILKSGGLVFVSHCDREKRVRIISARLAARAERRQYEEGI